jgi:hypothetical protein
MSAPPTDNRYPWAGLRRASVRAMDDYGTDDLLPSCPWEAALIEQYPNLFRRRDTGGAYKANCLAVGAGWRETVEILVQRLASIVQASPVAIVRIFENCGSMHVDTWAGDDVDHARLMEVDCAIALAAARSACTCEQCGCEGQLYCAGSTRTTRCAQHAVGDVMPVRPGLERVHLIHKLVGGRPGPIGAGRYDRATDAFIDVDPSTLDLGDRS